MRLEPFSGKKHLRRFELLNTIKTGNFPQFSQFFFVLELNRQQKPLQALLIRIKSKKITVKFERKAQTPESKKSGRAAFF